MTNHWRISIRSKILFVLTAVVIAAVGLYLYLASRIFYEDKSLLIYELNQTNVRTLAGDVEAHIDRVLDRLRLLLSFPGRETEVLPLALGGDEQIVRIGVLEKAKSGGGMDSIQAKTLGSKPELLSSYLKDAGYLDQLRQALPIPFDEVLRRGAWVRNATLAGANSPPLMTVALGDDSRVIYADVKLDPILEMFSHSGISRLELMDSDGFLLASPDHARIPGAASLKGDPLMQVAEASKVRSEVHQFDEDGKSYLGSFYRLGTAGMIATSRVEVGEAFAAAQVLVRKSLLYALVVVTAAFLISLFFSHSLTEPIQNMVEATRRIAQGNFNLFVPVTTHDELALLALSFNSMTTDLKASRGKIEEYSRDLEKKVAERTARIEAQNTAIKEAQEALLKSTRLASVGEIAGSAAHEVLNPLTNITARLEKVKNQAFAEDEKDLALLREITGAWGKTLAGAPGGSPENGKAALWRELSVGSKTLAGKTLLEEDVGNLRAIAEDAFRRLSDRRKDMDFLLKEAARINKIVNGMRQLARVSGNKTSLDLLLVVREAIETMQDLTQTHQIRAETEFPGAALYVLADRDEMLQIFCNLIRNSVQAIVEARKTRAPLGAPARIRVVARSVREPSGKRVELRFSDNGPGVPPGNFGHVFDSTFTTKSVENGTGLGLSICRRFVRAAGGEISLERSTPGVETVFYISLPEEARG